MLIVSLIALLIALLVFLFLLFLGLTVAVVAGLLVGYAFVAVSGKLSLTARVSLLVAVAAGTAALWLWLGLGEPSGVLLPLAMLVSFLATLASGATFLGLEARKRRASRYRAPAWQSW
ncbi:hypothetical protein [Streptomyces sp. A1547]|uniref:hypothetical protein n=1 Tax=Streptomyces sp. A1547 TaxID=2563105 RepID=UPI00109E8270|nr:hypothetical protein [Streptomyces sp. A1547]THA39815.1 hypothetical protein E6W17_09545 [Streptomyces sp. A1547]